MKTIKQLGALVKRQYPDYADMSDEQVGQLVKRKHPEDYADYFDEATIATISELKDYYNPQNGVLRNWWRRRKAESGIRLTEQLTQLQRQVIEQAGVMAEAVYNGKVKAVQFEEFLAQHQQTLLEIKVRGYLTQQAAAEGLTLENHQTQKTAEHSQKLHLERIDYEHRLQKDLKKIEHKYAKAERKMANKHEKQMLYAQQQHEMKMLEKAAEMRVYEANAIADAQLQRDLDFWNEKFRLAIIGKDPLLSGMQKRKETQALIDQCYAEIQGIKENQKLLPDIQTRMINDREEMIDFFKGENRVKILK